MLAGIRLIFQETGYPPTVRELGEHLGLRSSCTVQRHLEALERKGFIRRNPHQGAHHRNHPRTETGVEIRGRRWIGCRAIVGAVTAGLPILAVENIDDTIALPRSLVPEASASRCACAATA